MKCTTQVLNGDQPADSLQDEAPTSDSELKGEEEDEADDKPARKRPKTSSPGVMTSLRSVRQNL